MWFVAKWRDNPPLFGSAAKIPNFQLVKTPGKKKKKTFFLKKSRSDRFPLKFKTNRGNKNQQMEAERCFGF